MGGRAGFLGYEGPARLAAKKYKNAKQAVSLLLLRAGSRVALRDDLPCVLVKGSGLGQGFDGLLKLHVVFKVHLVAFGQPKHGDERFLANFSLDPAQVLRNIVLGIGDFFLVEISAERFHHIFVRDKVLGDFRLGSEEVSGESADSALISKENLAPQERFLEWVELRRRHGNVG